MIAARASARGDSVLVSTLDLDRFKALNDERGHEAGDEALKVVGAALISNMRGGDIAARTGGDEFVLVQVLREDDVAVEVAQRTRDEVEREIHTRIAGGEEVGVTIGFATASGDQIDLDALEAAADEALVEGKRTAKGAVYGV